MRQLSLSVIAAVSTFVSTHVACAADMPTKAPPVLAAPAVYNWTGFYVGGNVGYGWGSVKEDPLSMIQPGTLAGTFATLTAPANSFNADGAIGGGQIGYNWQSQNYLLGIEADIQASGQKGTDVFNTVIVNNVIAPSADPTTVTNSAKLNWFGTLRGRLGITNDRWLVYVTGGLAYGRVNINVNAQAAPSAGGANAPLIWNNSATKTGWVVGGGVENALSSKWSWKLEYLYMDLGSVTANVSGGAGNCYGPAGICASFSFPATGQVTARFTDSIVRAGVNYRF